MTLLAGQHAVINRASISYIIMLTLFVLGQWAVVEFGTNLRAAPDIGGIWEIAANADTPNSSPPWKKMIISQSGLYADVLFEEGPHLSSKLHRLELINPSGTADICGPATFAMNSNGWNLHLILGFTTGKSCQYMTGRIQGAQSFAFNAKRTSDKP